MQVSSISNLSALLQLAQQQQQQAQNSPLNNSQRPLFNVEVQLQQRLLDEIKENEQARERQLINAGKTSVTSKGDSTSSSSSTNSSSISSNSNVSSTKSTGSSNNSSSSAGTSGATGSTNNENSSLDAAVSTEASGPNSRLVPPSALSRDPCSKAPPAALPPGSLDKPSGASFNSLGNLSSEHNVKDFALLQPTPNQMLQQILNVNNIALNSAAIAAATPSLMLQMGMLLNFYKQTHKNDKVDQLALLSSRSSSADSESHVQQQGVITIAFLEQAYRLLELCQKNLSLSRFFKKGPVGDTEHSENTDDETASTFTEGEAEPDYIKRPRHEETNMDYHYSLLTHPHR